MRPLFLLVFLLTITLSKAQINLPKMAHFADSMVQHGVDFPMIPGAIMSIVTPDSIWINKGYGYSNFEQKIKVDRDRTLFHLGSVGKVLTSIAVLQQTEKGNLSLDQDVNGYLNNWQIKNDFEQAITIRDLLTHSAGFDDRIIGYGARSNKDLQPLSQQLPKYMPELFQAPGTSINYSNYSYALAGHLVELTSKENFPSYIQTHIFDPLKMQNSTYVFPDNHQESSKYARGYEWRESFNEKKVFLRNAAPAGGILSTGTDMARFIQALLNRDESLGGSQSFDLLFEEQFSNHHLLNGYTLGMEVQKIGGYDAVSKGGNIPGFLSILLLFPKEKVGLFISVNTETDNFLELFFDNFVDQFFPSEAPKFDNNLQVDPDEFTGVYISERTNHHTLEEMFHLFQGNFKIWPSENGNLACFHNGEWREYLAVENDVFENKDKAGQFLVFKRNEKGKITYLFRNVVIGGLEVPATLKKANWINSPRFLNDDYAFVLLFICSYLLFPIVWIGRRLFARNASIKPSLPRYFHGVALLFVVLFLVNVIGFFIPLLKDVESIIYGFPKSLSNMKYLNWVMVLNVLILLLLSAKIWYEKQAKFWFRIYYALFSLCALSYILMLHRWHFLNVTIL